VHPAPEFPEVEPPEDPVVCPPDFVGSINGSFSHPAKDKAAMINSENVVFFMVCLCLLHKNIRTF
jgi:hypothetical protein